MSTKAMAECHKFVLLSSTHLIDNRNAFRTNDSAKIKDELLKMIQTIDNIVHRKYGRVQDFYSDIYDNHLSELLHEFINIALIYLRHRSCIKGDSSFINIFRDYLCAYNCKNLNILYHYLANAGVIMSGCTRIYLNDSTLKGTDPVIIDNPQFFLNEILNAKYRVSKTKVKTCIIETFQKTGVRHLRFARVMLEDAMLLRKETKNICKKVFDKWSNENKNKHEKFEKELAGIVEQLDIAIRKLR